MRIFYPTPDSGVGRVFLVLSSIGLKEGRLRPIHQRNGLGHPSSLEARSADGGGFHFRALFAEDAVGDFQDHFLQE